MRRGENLKLALIALERALMGGGQDPPRAGQGARRDRAGREAHEAAMTETCSRGLRRADQNEEGASAKRIS